MVENNESELSGRFEDNQQPIEEIEPKLRLGRLIRRYRLAAEKSLRDLAQHLGVPEVAMGEVERGLAMLKAEQLQAIAEHLKVRYEPLLMAARDWNRAVFETHGHGGVQLSETTVTERALHGGEEMLERELIRCHDDLVFVANVSRELSIKAEKAARRARSLLAERGVPIPGIESSVVQCSGPAHEWKPHMMRLGIDFVLSYQEPPTEDGALSDKIFFCSEDCANEYRVVHGLDPLPETKASETEPEVFQNG